MEWHDSNVQRKSVTMAFVLGTILAASLDTKTNTAPTLVVFWIATAALLWAYYKSPPTNDVVSLLPAAVTLEVALYLWARDHTQAQLATTLAVATMLLAGQYWEWFDSTGHAALHPVGTILHLFYIQTHWYIYAWIAFRAVVILVEADSGPSRVWYISQLLLILCLLALMPELPFLEQDKRPTQLAVLAMFGVASLLYASPDTVPYGISLVLLIVPIYHITNSIVPHPYHDDAKDWSTSASAVVSLCCVAAALVWQRQLVHTAAKADSGITTYMRNRNIVPAYAGAKFRTPHPQYACAMSYMPHPNAQVVGCVPGYCYEAVKDGTTDCCRQLITSANIHSLVGHTLCANNATPG